MKRYRILSFDFDARANSLDHIPEHWEEHVKEVHRKNHQNIIRGLKIQYGEAALEIKIKNFIDLKAKPFSVALSDNY